MATFKIDDRDFVKAAKALTQREFGAIAGRTVASTLVKSANAVRRGVRAAAKPHRKTGRMASKVHYDRAGAGMDTVITVRPGGGVAHLVAEGTKPHDIRAGRGKALAIHRGGAVVAVRTVVHHPGYRPSSNFWDDGVRASETEVKTLVQAAAVTMVASLRAKLKAR